MKHKVAPKKEIIREDTIVSDNFTYSYSLSIGGDRGAAYFLKIVLKSPDGKVGSADASVSLSDGGRAIVFYNKLVNNLATPENLRYCIEDELMS